MLFYLLSPQAATNTCLTPVEKRDNIIKPLPDRDTKTGSRQRELKMLNYNSALEESDDKTS
jgi:hypothetical protein